MCHWQRPRVEKMLMKYLAYVCQISEIGHDVYGFDIVALKELVSRRATKSMLERRVLSYVVQICTFKDAEYAGYVQSARKKYK